MMKHNLNFETTSYYDGGIKGLLLSRKCTTEECQNIMYILGIDILDIYCFDNEKQYLTYIDELTNDINEWLTGELDDNVIMSYIWDNSDGPIGIWNSISIIEYLIKNKIIKQ